MAKKSPPRAQRPSRAASLAVVPVPVKTMKNEVTTREIKTFPKEVQNEQNVLFQNGILSDVLGLSAVGTGVQLSQVDTLYNNNRWYLVSNMRQLVAECYVEIPILQTIVDLPVDDAFRAGIEIKSKQLSPQNIQALLVDLDREQIMTHSVPLANKWRRLFGGGAIIIVTDQDWSTPFDINSIKKGDRVAFKACDMWELFGSQNTADHVYGAPGLDTTMGSTDDTTSEYFNFYGKRLHRSRVMILRGKDAPSYVRQRLRGWGLSVMEVLVRSFNTFLKTTDLAFEVLDEFKLDIFKIKNLTDALMSAQGQTRIQNRIQMANQQKNYLNALTMDKEDDYEQKQLSFTGIAEVMEGNRHQIASDVRIPMSKLFGTGSEGFSSGEDDLENYNAMVESEIRTKAKFEILRILEIKCQQKFGFVPDDLSFEYKPLRVLTSEQQENVKTQKFSRLIQAKTAGEISSEEFREACNRDNLLGIQLEASVELEGEDDTDEDEEGDAGAEPKKEKPASAPKDVKETKPPQEVKNGATD